MRRNAFPLFAFAFYVVTIFYPVLRVWWWYDASNLVSGAVATLLMIAFLVVPLALFLSRFVFRLRMPERFMPSLYSAIGCCFLFFPIVLVLEFVRWIPGFPHGFESLIAVVCALACAIYALLNAQRLHVKTLRISGKPQIENQSIVQLSDVHIGSRSPKYLERIVKKVQRLDPTWVVITGDLLDSQDIGKTELDPLRQIADRTLLVTGNHERYEGIDRVTSILESLGVRVLRNEEVDALPFQFVGIDDHDSPSHLIDQLKRFEPLQDAYRVLLYHRPHGMEHASNWGFDLMLVGHTHRGQIFPFHLIVRRFFRFIHGTHRFGNMTLHISSGTGTWGPILRLGSRNEITRVVFA